MTHLAIRLLLLCCLFTCSASGVYAQANGTAEPVNPWSLTGGITESFDSAATSIGTQTQGDWATRYHAGVRRSSIMRRGNVDFSGDATQLTYNGVSGQDTFMYNANAGASYAFTRRLSVRASESWNNSYAEDSSVLRTAGLVLPRTLVTTSVASTDISYLLTSLSTIRAEVSHTRIAFKGALTSATSTMTRFSFARQVGRAQSVGVSLGNTFTSGTTGDIQGLLVTWQASVGRSLTLTAAGGVRPYTLYGVSGYKFAPGGSFGLTAQVSEGQAVSVGYERALEQAYGVVESLGGGLTHAAHRFNGNYGVTLGRRLALDVSANYGLNTYPQIANFQIYGRTVMLGARYLVARNLTVATNYGLWVRGETGAPSESTYRTGISLAYGYSWR